MAGIGNSWVSRLTAKSRLMNRAQRLIQTGQWMDPPFVVLLVRFGKVPANSGNNVLAADGRTRIHLRDSDAWIPTPCSN